MYEYKLNMSNIKIIMYKTVRGVAAPKGLMITKLAASPQGKVLTSSHILTGLSGLS